MSNRNKCAIVVLAMLPFANGCSNMNNTQADALGGGAIGATAGALLDRRNPVAGAAVGGLLGAGTGAMVGSAADADQRRVNAAAAVASTPGRQPLALTDIVDLVRHGIGDGVIIDKIHSTGSVYYLTVEQITWLHDNGVSDVVIQEMQRTRYHRRPVYVYG
jgi:hypothetical protein